MSEVDNWSEDEEEIDPEEAQEYLRQVQESDVTSVSFFLSCLHHNWIDLCMNVP